MRVLTTGIARATIVTRHAGEMIGELTLAIVAGLAGDAYNRTRLTPGVKKLFGAWLRWTR